LNLKPPPLKKGDRVGVIAPAGPVSPSDLEPGIKRLMAFGLDVTLGPHLYENTKYTAGDDHARLDDLHAMFGDPEIRGVFCARGGYGCLRLLPLIDLDLITNDPKIVMGFSDITALLLGLYSRTGLVAFHGPVVRGFAKKNERDIHTFFQWMDSPASPPELILPDFTKVLAPGNASGKVFGGNLSLFTHLIGTGYMPDLDGAILFLEDTNEPLYRIDRMLTHLHLAGVFKKLSGFLAGDFSENIADAEVNDLLLEYLEPLKIPVVTGLPVGHGKANTPMPIGIPATLDTDNLTLSYDEACFSV
jgi:muramoyltetrapeptide carboxypeptidase